MYATDGDFFIRRLPFPLLQCQSLPTAYQILQIFINLSMNSKNIFLLTVKHRLNYLFTCFQ